MNKIRQQSSFSMLSSSSSPNSELSIIKKRNRNGYNYLNRIFIWFCYCFIFVTFFGDGRRGNVTFFAHGTTVDTEQQNDIIIEQQTTIPTIDTGRLTCHPSNVLSSNDDVEEEFSCIFTYVIKKNKDRDDNSVNQQQQQFHYCPPNNNEYCIQSKVQMVDPIIPNYVSSRISSSSSGGGDSTSRTLHQKQTTMNKQQDEQQQETQPKQQQQQQRQQQFDDDDDSKNPKTKSAGNEDTTNTNSDSIQVGIATYYKPWSQYNAFVYESLVRKPYDNSKYTTKLDWSNWYHDLGMAHYRSYDAAILEKSSSSSSSFDPNDNLDDWYEMELALNAYQQAISILDDDNDIEEDNNKEPKNDLKIFEEKIECDIFKSSISYQIGETYLIHPEGLYKNEALEYFEMSYEIYNSIRINLMKEEQEQEESSTSTVGILSKEYRDIIQNVLHKLLLTEYDINIRYADACSRICTILTSTIQALQIEVQLIQQQQQTEAFGGGLFGATDPMMGGTGGKSSSKKEQKEHQQQLEQQIKEFSNRAEYLIENSISIYKTNVQKMEENERTTNDYRTNSRYYHGTTMIASDQITLYIGLTTSLHTGASLATLQGKVNKSLQYVLEGLNIHQTKIMNLVDPSRIEYSTSKTAVADLLLTAADSYLQLGDYPNCKLYYKQAMEWYDTYNINIVTPQQAQPLAGGGGIDIDNDPTIKSYLHALSEYHRMVKNGDSSTGGGNNNDYMYRGMYGADGGGSSSNQYYIIQDDLYEGDLHASIGALYLSYGATERAIIHLENAIELYETIMIEEEEEDEDTDNNDEDNDNVYTDSTTYSSSRGSGSSSSSSSQSTYDTIYNTFNSFATGNTKSNIAVTNKRPMADAKFNLAMAYFYSRQFQDGINMYYDACNLYNELYGPNINPLKQGYDDQIEDLLSTLGGGGVGGLGGGLGGIGNGNGLYDNFAGGLGDLAASLFQKSSKQEEEPEENKDDTAAISDTSSSSSSSSSNRNNNNNDKDSQEGVKIDLDQYKQSIMNATAQAAAKLSGGNGHYEL